MMTWQALPFILLTLVLGVESCSGGEGGETSNSNVDNDGSGGEDDGGNEEADTKDRIETHNDKGTGTTESTGPTEPYDPSKCKPANTCKKNFTYLALPYDGKCVKGEMGRRPWCSSKTDDKGQHIGEKICCVCPNWHGSKKKCNEKEDPCKAGWTKLNGRCYFFSSQKMNYQEGSNFCKNKDEGRFVSVESEEEARALQKFIMSPYNLNFTYKDGFWLGANDRKKENEWIWEFNGKKVDDTWANWGVHQKWVPKKYKGREPNNAGPGQDCMYISSNIWGHPVRGIFVGNNTENYKWIDIQCSEKNNFPICEFGA